MTSTNTKTIKQLIEEMKLNISSRAVALSDCIGLLKSEERLITACRTYAESTITEKPEELAEWVQTMGGIAGFWMESVIADGKYCARPAYYIFYDHVRCAWVEMETEILEKRHFRDALKFIALFALNYIEETGGYLTEEEQDQLAAFLENCANCVTGDDMIEEFEKFENFIVLNRQRSA